MVVIRLSRAGTKKKPFYHLAVTDKRNPRDGRFIERVGFYNPVARGKSVPMRVDLARVDYWVGVGAQLSPKVKSIVAKARKIDSLPPESLLAEANDGMNLEKSEIENAASEDETTVVSEEATKSDIEAAETEDQIESAELEASSASTEVEQIEESAAEATEATDTDQPSEDDDVSLDESTDTNIEADDTAEDDSEDQEDAVDSNVSTNSSGGDSSEGSDASDDNSKSS